MQGVRVSGMLVWTVNRMGDGPFNAYKNLGDISSGDPRTANDSLVSMSSAVVRSCIANSTIQEMITNRKLLREAIHKEMFEVVKGWGVWLETIEITGVTICSSSLFKDLQTNYRETMRQQATLFQMQIKSELEQVQNQNSLTREEKQREITEKESQIVAKANQENKESKEAFLLKKSEMLKEKEELSIEHQLFKAAEAEKLSVKLGEYDMQYALAKDKAAMKNEIEQQRYTVETNKSAEEALTRRLETKKLQQDHKNEIKKAEQDLEKRNLGDEHMLRHKAIKLAHESYAGKYVEKVRVNNMAKDDPSTAVLTGLLSKYELCKEMAGANT